MNRSTVPGIAFIRAICGWIHSALPKRIAQNRPATRYQQLMKPHGLIALVFLSGACITRAASVEILATPGQGIQPRALVASDGSLQLVWYEGSEKGGDVWHAKRIGGNRFSEPVRVNSEPATAVAAGTIRGAQAVMGREGRVHVVWNGAMKHKRDRAPLYYTRMAGDGKAFEPQRAMSGDWIMDGGGAVAADNLGHVLVFYHGDKGGGRDEAARRVLVRSSSDDGRTFGAERVISPDGAGVCACCAMQAIAADDGTVMALYRTAFDGGRQRDIALLTSHDGGKTFAHTVMDRWRIAACPMSSMSLAAGREGIIAAWEREGQIYVAPAGDAAPGVVVSPEGKPDGRKHPVLAVRGEQVMVAWTEGTGWQKGGGMAWQILEGGALRPSAASGRAPGVKVWSFISAAPRKDGFVIVQ